MIINKDNIDKFAYTNIDICVNPKGVAIEFTGLGGQTMFTEPSDFAKKCAENGVVYVFPYLNPWNWMNEFAARESDEIIAAVMDKCGLDENAPVVSAGGSMGGLCALAYMKRAKKTPVACVANCPVCDLPYHFTERSDLPRTLYSAFGGTNEEELDAEMRKSSPLHIANELPDAEYVIFHCTADKAVNKEMHSDRFVAELKKRQNVDYFAVEGRGHCDLTPEMRAKYEDRIITAAARTVKK